MNPTLLFITALLLAPLGALHADAAPPQRPVKKLIEYGWDVPYPDQVRRDIRNMEKKPFDGIIFRLREWNHAFDPRPWDEAKLKPQLDDLAVIEWKTFTDNFLCLYAANNWKMDWFNDEQWKGITANLRLSAKAAKIGRCVGIVFDPEPYGDNPWAYPGKNKDRSFVEVEAHVRKRGAQFMTAIQSEMPEARLLTFFHQSLFAGLLDMPDVKKRQLQLSKQHWGLLSAFWNGALETAAPGVRIIDGYEPSYYFGRRDQFFWAYRLMRQRSLAMVPAELRAKHAVTFQAGMALYMDEVLALRQPPEKYLSTYLTPQDRLRWWEHNVYYALTTSDQYVWCYSERMNWWQDKVPDGAEAALRSARKKIADGQPLGFDIADFIAAGQKKMNEAAKASKTTTGAAKKQKEFSPVRTHAGNAASPQPAKSDVFVAGQDGVHTYRIPAMIVSPSGVLLVFCEARKEGIRDASPTDMVLKRSLDGGKTWLPMQTLVRGEGTDAVMNPVALTERTAGTVFLLCCNTNRRSRGEHRRHLLLSSRDDGQTWSAPAAIGSRIADYDDTFVPGPGCGIQTGSGRLVIPGYTSPEKMDAKTEEGFRSRVIYSDDGGKSWRMGKPVDSHTDESQVIELADGRLMLNMRQGTGQSCRAVAISKDGGESWEPVSWDRALNECPCQASILRHSRADKDGRSIILFANPDNAGARYGAVERTKMTVRTSYDEGRTWAVKKLIHVGPSSYSGLVRLPNNDVGLVFEGGERHRREWIRFMRLPLAWLADSKDLAR